MKPLEYKGHAIKVEKISLARRGWAKTQAIVWRPYIDDKPSSPSGYDYGTRKAAIESAKRIIDAQEAKVQDTIDRSGPYSNPID
jgi:hypothetical protein